MRAKTNCVPKMGLSFVAPDSTFHFPPAEIFLVFLGGGISGCQSTLQLTVRSGAYLLSSGGFVRSAALPPLPRVRGLPTGIFMSHFLATERCLWSSRPLTSHISFCALCCLPLCAHVQQPEFVRGGGSDSGC